ITIHQEGPRAELGDISITGNQRDSADEIMKYLGLQSGHRYGTGLAQRLKDDLDASSRFLSVSIDRANTACAIEGIREIVDLRIDVREYDRAPRLADDFSPEEKGLLKM